MGLADLGAGASAENPPKRRLSILVRLRDHGCMRPGVRSDPPCPLEPDSRCASRGASRPALRLILCAALVLPLLAFAQAATSAATATDNFNRANGGLGSGWSAVSDGGLSISSQACVGTSATAGDIRTGETYPGDQYSQVEVTSTQLSGGQWIGPAVRMQNGGQNQYLGIYFWNNGTQQLRLYKRSAGTWIQLGSSYNSGPLAAGTQLKLTAVGSTISFLQNGVARITVTDSSVTGGAPGIMTFGTGQGRQLGGRRSAPPHRADVLGRRDRVRPVGDGGAAGQRR